MVEDFNIKEITDKAEQLLRNHSPDQEVPFNIALPGVLGFSIYRRLYVDTTVSKYASDSMKKFMLEKEGRKSADYLGSHNTESLESFILQQLGSQISIKIDPESRHILPQGIPMQPDDLPETVFLALTIRAIDSLNRIFINSFDLESRDLLPKSISKELADSLERRMVLNKLAGLSSNIADFVNLNNAFLVGGVSPRPVYLDFLNTLTRFAKRKEF